MIGYLLIGIGLMGVMMPYLMGPNYRKGSSFLHSDKVRIIGLIQIIAGIIYLSN